MARILIIDDDHGVRSATKILLEAHGFEVVAVDNGKAGVEAMEADGFDLAIVDLFMPNMDGLQTSQRLRERDASMPIIAVSGFMFGGPCPEMPNFGAMAAEAGASATLYKPFRPAELLQAVRNAIGVVV